MTRWCELTLYSLILLASLTVAAIATSLATQGTAWYWVFCLTAGLYGVVAGMALRGLWGLWRRHS